MVITLNPFAYNKIEDVERNADVAHLVERHLAKVEVAGSSPVIRSLLWRYSQVVRQESAKLSFPGSNPGDASLINSSICFEELFLFYGSANV